jgi:DNA segregation ATPase FtsK/SpoIIIE, S-DNA-T family
MANRRGRPRKFGANQTIFQISSRLAYKLSVLALRKLIKLSTILGIALAWIVFRPIVAVLEFILFELALLPLRILRVFSWIWETLTPNFFEVTTTPSLDLESNNAAILKPKKINQSFLSSAKGFVAAANLPEISLIQENHSENESSFDSSLAEETGKLLEEKLECFGIQGKVIAIRPGPVITQFEYKLSKETKISKIISLEDDLSMALSVVGVRIIAPIPGKNAIGFEIAHSQASPVFFDKLLQSKEWLQASDNKNFALPLMLGTDGVGKPVAQDLATMPHLLVAGSTGSGKSVAMHSMISSLLMTRTPAQLRIILIDPKRLEFSPYAQIPHLLCPVVTNMEKVSSVLAWLVFEMERRYQKMSELGLRTIADLDQSNSGEFPRIVAFIDELADLMMIGGKDVENHLVRLAQMARAAGIHLVVATQRPSVDVVTGLIKVNFPSRIAFRVSSRVDSRTILDEMGAERLLGRGDMLFMHPSVPFLQRIHGAYISNTQVENLTNSLRSSASPEYVDMEHFYKAKRSHENQEIDELYDQAHDFAKSRDEVSISILQRHLRIGFNRSARLIDQLEQAGVVAPAQGSKPRKVL